jgi:hypothetical protein
MIEFGYIGGYDVATLTGTYTYIDDPNQACEGLWELQGETEL